METGFFLHVVERSKDLVYVDDVVGDLGGLQGGGVWAAFF